LLAVINDAYGISLSAFRIGVVVNFKKARKLAILSDIKCGSKMSYLPTQSAKASVTESAVTLTTLLRTERIGWQRFTPAKVASPSAVPVHPPPL
jgi:hypothetical protein